MRIRNAHIKLNNMTKQEILDFIDARERQLYDEYFESRDVNGYNHEVTKKQFAIWNEINKLKITILTAENK